MYNLRQQHATEAQCILHLFYSLPCDDFWFVTYKHMECDACWSSDVCRNSCQRNGYITIETLSPVRKAFWVSKLHVSKLVCSVDLGWALEFMLFDRGHPVVEKFVLKGGRSCNGDSNWDCLVCSPWLQEPQAGWWILKLSCHCHHCGFCGKCCRWP